MKVVKFGLWARLDLLQVYNLTNNTCAVATTHQQLRRVVIGRTLKVFGPGGDTESVCGLSLLHRVWTMIVRVAGSLFYHINCHTIRRKRNA